MYAYFKKLDYFSTECLYAPFAARGYARDFVKVPLLRPLYAILDSDIIHGMLDIMGPLRQVSYMGPQPRNDLKSNVNEHDHTRMNRK